MASIQDLIRQRKKKELDRPKPMTKEQLEEQVTDWCDFYRKNWDMYARHELGMTSLRPFQEYVLYEMGISDYFFFMCSRGSSKSFLTATSAFICSMIYPNSTVVITATTKATSKEMFNRIMKKELCGDVSPKLKFLYEMGEIIFKDTEDEVSVIFKFNGSKILFLPEVEASAGKRATMLIFEESRLLKSYFVNRIFMPMRYARPSAYRMKDEYKDDQRYVEKARVIFLTSTSYTFEWWFDKWRAIVAGYFNENSKLRYGIFASDIFTSINHGFTSADEFEAIKDDSTISDAEIKMEYYNEPQGDMEGSFYSMEKIKENSVIDEGFIPPTYEDFILKYDSDTNNLFRKKEDKEIRVIYVDFASSNSVKKGQENDNTVIGCMSGIPNGTSKKKATRIIRNLDYMETMSGGKRDETLKRIRELFYFYQADVFVYDNQQVGIDRFGDLTKPFYHEELGIILNGFTIYNDSNIVNNFCDKTKSDDIRSNAVDNNAMQVAIPVVGSLEKNALFHITLQTTINKGLILFLSDRSVVRRKLEEDPSWFMKTHDEKARRLIGHKNVEEMATEAVELRQSIKQGKIALEEIPHHTKDRIVATSYANYFFHLLEQKMLKKNQNDDFKEEDWYDLFL